MKKISVVLATFNEEKNIGRCLESVNDFADEIVIVDGESNDRTVSIAKSHGAKVHIRQNEKNFNVNKQKAIDLANSEWILLMDADEQVSKKLRKELEMILGLSDEEMNEYQEKMFLNKHFAKHKLLIETRDGKVGNEKGTYNAFFIPRANLFLGRFLKYGGVYPDGVIRLFKKGKAHFPCQDVHEQIDIDGKVGWLKSDLLHYSDPSFARYISRWNGYTSFIAGQIKDEKKNVFTPLKYLLISPIYSFVMTYGRHKGFLDSWQGFVFALFSSLRFPVSYVKYLTK